MEPQHLEAHLQSLHPLGFAWAVRCCQGDKAEAEDVLHMAYVRVLDGRAKFDGRSAFKTWLFGVIRRTALEHHRWRWSQATRLGRWLLERLDPPDDPTATMDSDEVSGKLEVAMRQLSKRQGQVLHLVFYQDLTIEEAAQLLGLRVGTARTHYERGKARMRQLLAAMGVTE